MKAYAVLTFPPNSMLRHLILWWSSKGLLLINTYFQDAYGLTL